MPLPKTKALRTSADDLVELVRIKGKISVDELSNALKLPKESVSATIDFLVEEKIIGIEYKFTTPYVFINREKDLTRASGPESELLSKDLFFRKCESEGRSLQQAGKLWASYLEENMNTIKRVFLSKAYSRGASGEVAEKLWDKYLKHLQ